MKISFANEVSEIKTGVLQLAGEYGFTVAESDGLVINVKKSSQSELCVTLSGSKAEITYQETHHFFRGLGLLLEAAAKAEDFNITEVPQFTTNGAMFDCSRNAVLKTNTVHKLIRKMAIMGLNVLMLYTEDTYTIEGEPLFGYMRGRYSAEELKEIDDYAHAFGIEVIPCIQTLAHLATFLRWNTVKHLRDNEDILLAGSEATYAFIEKMIAAASAPFRSKKIHIGMDEAWALGRGKFHDQFGCQQRFDIMINHLNEVLQITRKYQLEPMIWSDMFFRIASPDNDYYDLQVQIPEEVKSQIPEDVSLVYWDYYHHEESFYAGYIQRHQQLGTDTVFAGGIWTWSGPCTSYQKTFATTNAALQACKQNGIKHVFATLWGDDGAENNVYSGLLGLQLYAEHGFSRNVPDQNKLQQRFAACTGGDMEAFMKLGEMDAIATADVLNWEPDNPTKFLLWQDVLLGLYDKHVQGLGAGKHYEELQAYFKHAAETDSQWTFIFQFTEALSAVLRIKSEIGNQLKSAYDQQDKQELGRLAQRELKELGECIQELRRVHRSIWMACYKPFGWEILDHRYGGLIARVDSAAERVKDYVSGHIDKLEELEAEKLFYDGFVREPGQGIGKAYRYHRISSTNVY